MGGAHGGEDGFDVGRVLLLGLVDDQQVVGRLTAAGGLRVAAQKDDRRPAQRVARWPAATPPPAARPRRVEPLLQPAHAPPQPVADGPVDHLPVAALQEGQQVDQQLGHRLVLARLAREDQQELAPAAMEHGVDDGPQWLQLVVVEGQADDVAGEEADVIEDMAGHASAVGRRPSP